MDMSVPTKLSKFIQHGKVFIFSITNCPFCDKAKELLDSFEVKYEYKLVDLDPTLNDDEDFISTLESHAKIDTYPKVYIGTNCVGGYSDLFKLSENMKLFTMLKKEKIRFADDDMI